MPAEKGGGREAGERGGELYQRLVDRRTAAVIGLRDLTTNAEQAVAALKRANDRFLAAYERTTKFSERLSELVPIDLYDAVDPISFEELVQPGAVSVVDLTRMTSTVLRNVEFEVGLEHDQHDGQDEEQRAL